MCMDGAQSKMLPQYPLSIPTPAALPSSPSFFALGDSYSAGIGANCGWITDGFDKSLECLRCTGAFPHQVLNFANITGMETHHISCTGSPIHDITHVSDTNRTAQVDFMKSVPSEVGWGTLTIGGNDVGFASIVANCIAFNKASCDKDMNFTEEAIANPKLIKKLSKTYLSVLETANSSDFTLIVPGYAQFFNARTKECDAQYLFFGRYLTQELRARVNNMVAGLNVIIQVAIAVVQLHLVFKNSMKAIYYEDWDAMFEGHRFCEQKPKTWADAWFFTIDGPDTLPNGTFMSSHHPKHRIRSKDMHVRCDGRAMEDLGEQMVCDLALADGLKPGENVTIEGYPWWVMKIMHPKTIAHHALGQKIFEKWKGGEYFLDMDKLDDMDLEVADVEGLLS